MNTETQPTKRTAQEIFEQRRAGRKQYLASPEGKKASAEAARLMDIAKAKDEPAMMDAETIEALLKRDRERTRSAEAEKIQIVADTAQFAEEVAQRDRERRQALRDLLFEDSELAKLASSTPQDFARALGRSENYITETAQKLKLQKTEGRWVFDKPSANRLYDHLTKKMRNGFTTA